MTLATRIRMAFRYARSLFREPLTKAELAEKRRATNDALKRAVERRKSIERQCFLAVSEALKVSP